MSWSQEWYNTLTHDKKDILQSAKRLTDQTFSRIVRLFNLIQHPTGDQAFDLSDQYTLVTEDIIEDIGILKTNLDLIKATLLTLQITYPYDNDRYMASWLSCVLRAYTLIPTHQRIDIHMMQ